MCAKRRLLLTDALSKMPWCAWGSPVTRTEGLADMHSRLMVFLLCLAGCKGDATGPSDEIGDPTGRILFGRPGEGIFSVLSNGAGLAQLTSEPGDILAEASPDGSRITVMRVGVFGQFDIFVMNRDGSDLENLTRRPDFDGFPSWSPDGTKIAFHSFRIGFHDNYIVVVSANGSSMTRLSNGADSESYADWFPDGTRLTFTSAREGNFEVYRMDGDGTDAGNLTQHPAHDRYGRVSPDGRRIVFMSDRDGNSDIYVMRSDGTGQTNLSLSDGDDTHPDWSPDGDWIVFTSDRSGQSELYIMTVEGLRLTQITNDGPSEYPRWGRCPLTTSCVASPGGPGGGGIAN